MKIGGIVNQKQSLLLVGVRPQHFHFWHCRSQFLYRFLHQRIITVIVDCLDGVQVNGLAGQNRKRSFIVASVFQLKTNALDPVHSFCRNLLINADCFLQRQVIVVFSEVWKFHALCYIVGQIAGWLLYRGGFRLCLCMRVDSALFADFLIVALNVGDQSAGGFVDGLQTGSQFFQLLALTPTGNIAKAVFSSLDAKILADRIGDAFSLHFFRVTIFPLFLQKLGEGRKATGKIQPFFLGQHQASIFRQFQRLCQQNGACMVYNHSFFHTDRISRIVVRTAQIITINALWQIIASNPSVGEQTKFIKQLDLLILLVIGNLDLFLIVELAVSNLVNRGRNRLHLAHALTNGNFLMIGRKIAVRIGGHCFKSNRHRCAAAQGLHECLIIWHIAGKGGSKLRQRFPVGLTHIKDLDRAKHGNLDFFFLCDDLSVFIQNRSLGIWVQLLLLDFLLIRCGSDDGNAMLALFYMTLKLVFPLIVSGYQCGVRLLHIDEHGVVYRIAVKSGHDGQITHILFAFKQFFDTLLDAICDFP